MTKSDYLSNSSKLLLICSCLLFVNSALTIISGFVEGAKGFAGTFTSICFYGVLIMGFLAFNGEGISYKHTKSTGKRKATIVLKILLVSVFLFRYIKTPVTAFLLGFDAQTATGVISRLFMSFLNTVASYGFLMTVIAMWFILRDKNVKKIIPFAFCSLFSGLVYNGFKFINYAIVKYGVTVSDNVFSNVFTNEMNVNILALVQFGFNIIMCIAALRYYESLVPDEHEENEKNVKKMVTARNIYSTDCVGIDSLEDDFFIDNVM